MSVGWFDTGLRKTPTRLTTNDGGGGCAEDGRVFGHRRTVGPRELAGRVRRGTPRVLVAVGSRPGTPGWRREATPAISTGSGQARTNLALRPEGPLTGFRRLHRNLLLPQERALRNPGVGARKTPHRLPPGTAASASPLGEGKNGGAGVGSAATVVAGGECMTGRPLTFFWRRRPNSPLPWERVKIRGRRRRRKTGG